MRQLLTILFILVACRANSQLTGAEPIALQQLVQSIAGENNSTDDRIKSAYSWVTSNISYNTDSIVYLNWSLTQNEQVAATLRRRKGVCENYASLFSSLLTGLGIDNYIVRGEALGSFRSEFTAHSWVAAKSSAGWRLYDPTWDAGRSQPIFYAQPGEIFVSSHRPFDPLWQLLPETKLYRNKLQFPNLEDSVTFFIGLDSLRQLEASGRRMDAAGMENSLTDNWYQYNKMNIHLQKENNYLYLYEKSNGHLNNAVRLLNKAINSRNEKEDEISDTREFSELLNAADAYLQMAKFYADSLALEKENFQFDAGFLLERHERLQKVFNEQKAFLSSLQKARR